MTSMSASAALEAIQKATTATTCHLSQSVTVDTAQFMRSVSLRILPLSQRIRIGDESTRSAQAREARFRELMGLLAQAFARDDEREFEWANRATLAILTEQDQILAAEFIEIVRLWRADKAQTRAQQGRRMQASGSEAPASAPAGGDAKAHPAAEQAEKRRESTENKTFDRSRQSTPHPDRMAVGGFEREPAPADRHEAAASSPPRPSSPTGRKPRSMSTAPPPRSAARETPNEHNSWAVESGDGVLVGHPPAYPPGLLDWDDQDMAKRAEEVARRHAREKVAMEPVVIAGEGMARGGGSRRAPSLREKSGEGSGFDGTEEDSDWVRL